MEEAEALCDRIAIQVKGQLRCLGSPNHIKQKYGNGYQLEVFCSKDTPLPLPSIESQMSQRSTQSRTSIPPPDRTERISHFIESNISSSAKLLESHADRYLFQLPPLSRDNPVTLGKIFMVLQVHMAEIGITDYSLTQPSLEQVFLRFAREQETP